MKAISESQKAGICHELWESLEADVVRLTPTDQVWLKDCVFGQWEIYLKNRLETQDCEGALYFKGEDLLYK